MVSAMDQGGEMLSLLIAQCHYVFLYRDLFPGHQSAPSAATEPSNQTNTAESMTGATSAPAKLSRPSRSLPRAQHGERWSEDMEGRDVGRCSVSGRCAVRESQSRSRHTAASRDG